MHHRAIHSLHEGSQPNVCTYLCLLPPRTLSMWLLSTDRAELTHFVSPESVPTPGYAILSHVWGDNEQSLQESQVIIAKCRTTSRNPRDLVSDKIRESCELAERHGYRWLWIDSCCIDKTSSAELSEAINSMFHYYSSAAICYVYLQDVPSDSDESDPSKLLARSRWFRRGWTLQELVAPRLVLFLSQSWEIIGSKADYAALIEETTNIPATILRLEQPLADFSIAQRMSWASGRSTTRVEDEAYCLLGIFDINMPTLYGEGRKAFRRLQEEIMRHFPDTTLFAWGPCCEPGELCGESDGISEVTLVDDYTLFAPSPAAFAGCHDLEFQPRADGPSDEVSVLQWLTLDSGAGALTSASLHSHGPRELSWTIAVVQQSFLSRLMGF